MWNIHENQKNERKKEKWELMKSIERERVQEKVEKSGNDDDPEDNINTIKKIWYQYNQSYQDTYLLWK